MRRLSDPLLQRLRSTKQGAEQAPQRLWTHGYFLECGLDEQIGAHQYFIEIDNKRPARLHCRGLNDVMATQPDWLHGDGSIGTHP